MIKKLKAVRLWVWATIVVVLAAAAAATFLLLPSALQNPDERLGTKIPDLIPSSADMVVISPAYKDAQGWWDNVSGHMTKDASIDKVKPYGNDSFALLNFGYSRSANPDPKADGGIFIGPDQALYIESKTEDGAKNVEKMLADPKVIDPKTDTVSLRVGNINIIARKFTMDHFTKTNKDKNVGFISSRKDFVSQSPTLWMNFDQQQEILSTGAKSGQSDAVKKMFENGLGISSGTVWQSTSKDDGATWAGSYVSGGVKASNLNPQAANTAFMDDSKVVQTLDNKPTDGSPVPANATTHSVSVIDPGLSKMLDYFSVQYSDPKNATIGNPGSNPPAGKNIVSADLKLIAWNNLTQFTGVGTNDYSTESIRATEGGMSIHFAK